MEREIKFRAQHEGEWHYFTLGDLVCGSTQTTEYCDSEFSSWCQFIGIQDKNGVDIYDDDILKNTETGESGGVVMYFASGHRGCYYQVQDARDRENGHTGNLEMIGIPGDGWMGHQIEVIGNIHQHKHLLDEQTES